MTLGTNTRVAGVTLWIYFAAGIASLLLAGNAPATAVLALLIAAAGNIAPAINVPTALLTLYLVIGRGRVPEAIRTPSLLAGGVLLPIVVMVYWLWRVRGRRSVRGIVRVSAPEAAV